MEMKMLELWQELNKLPSATLNRLMGFQSTASLCEVDSVVTSAPFVVKV
jgi:hypothetical protein